MWHRRTAVRPVATLVHYWPERTRAPIEAPLSFQLAVAAFSMHFQCELVRLVSAVAVVVRPAAQNFHTDVRFDKRQLDLAPPNPNDTARNAIATPQR